jgi:hypothetical protein
VDLLIGDPTKAMTKFRMETKIWFSSIG